MLDCLTRRTLHLISHISDNISNTITCLIHDNFTFSLASATYVRRKIKHKVDTYGSQKYYPTTNGGMQNESSVGIYTHCTHVFVHHGANLYAQSLLNNKISALELNRRVIKSALLVGQALRSSC